MPNRTAPPPPYRTPFLDWDDAALAALDARQSFYKTGKQQGVEGGGKKGTGGTLVSYPWLKWFNDLLNFITGRGTIFELNGVEVSTRSTMDLIPSDAILIDIEDDPVNQAAVVTIGYNYPLSAEALFFGD